MGGGGGELMDRFNGEGRLDVSGWALERIFRLLKIHPCEVLNLK
jgi:hypothetical protein